MPRRIKTASKRTVKKSLTIECPHCRQNVIPSNTGRCPSCLNLIDVVPCVPDVQPSASPYKLWTPRQIAVLSFFMGYPSGLVLSSINWIRMGETGTAIIHLIAGFLLMTVWTFILGFGQASCGLWLGLALNIGFCFYLYQQMKSSINNAERDGHEIMHAAWRSGCLTGVVTFFAFILLLGLVNIILSSAR